MFQVSEEIASIAEEDKKIFANFPLTLDEAGWSKRQIKFLKTNKNLVINLVKEYSTKDNYIGLNYKKALVETKAVEAIPYLIDFYKNKDNEDKDILTLLMILVKDAKYYPFSRSNIFKQLYNEDISYNDSYIEYNNINEEYILKTAENYYKQNPKIR